MTGHHGSGRLADSACHCATVEGGAIADSPSLAGASGRLRALLVDGDSAFADEIVREFGHNGLNVNAVGTLADARTFLRQSHDGIDVVIVALHLTDGRAESLLPDIEACARQPAVIIVSEYLPDLDPGALEYRPVALPKPVSPAALLRVVRTVVGGFAQPSVHRFVKRFNLTKREAEATVLLAQGLRVKEIADSMRCSEKTVYAHLVRVSKKTGCRGYHEVVCLLLAFSCHVLGHAPPGHPAFVIPVPSPTSRP